MVERGGKTLVILTESKKGVSSWVRMGLNSVGLFMEGLHQCIEDVKEGSGKRAGRRRGEVSPWYVLLTGRVVFCDWGRRFGVEEIQYMYPKGQRGQGGMDGDGRGSSAVGY
ncbi:hypothetical protein CK203_048651 [Vitis vinifera]|uniref:Uncharacterized protein n=1 Tax=Vitis vinifera TaxID=29760 RepID=A0A438GWK7_VITVI|nr:hypothetical protein CK203_048651 [Vitis vinifera]